MENVAENKKICLNWSYKRPPRASTEDCGKSCRMANANESQALNLNFPLSFLKI